MAAQAPAINIDNVRIASCEFTMPRIQVRDRRSAGRPLVWYVFQRHLERILYGRDDGGSTGPIWKLLNASGMGSTALSVNAHSVGSNQVTRAEYDAILDCFKSTLDHVDPSSLGRVRSCTLLPMAAAAAIARSFGRSPASTGFLAAFGQQVPQSWQLQAQQDQHNANNERDLLLDEQLEDQGLEVEDISFGEELTMMAKFACVTDDDRKMQTYAINPVPGPLKASMEKYVANRTAVFSARRAGGAAASSTAESDVQSLYRFFGWMHRTNRVPQGALLWLSFLERADLGDKVQEYAEWLQNTQQIRFSSIANYLNGLASIVSYVYANYDLPAETAALDPSPLTMVLNLRGQAEKQSRTQNMYEKRVGGWLTWAEVQQCRVKALQQVAGCSPADKRSRLRDATAMSLLSLLPPDRVGVVAWQPVETSRTQNLLAQSDREPQTPTCAVLATAHSANFASATRSRRRRAVAGRLI